MSAGARLVLLGRQGAGKGTQCVRLSRHYVIAHISTGDILRAASRDGTELGRRVKATMDAGELVPDQVMVEIIEQRLARDDTRRRGFVLDGFPRTTAQAEALTRMIEPARLDVAVNLEVPRDLVLARLAGRLVCSDCGANYSVQQPPKYGSTCDACGGEVIQRPDDTDAAINRRLDLYEVQTAPLIAWFEAQGLLETVDGTGSPIEIFERLVKLIDQRLGAR